MLLPIQPVPYMELEVRPLVEISLRPLTLMQSN